jgi:hypothetical protein
MDFTLDRSKTHHDVRLRTSVPIDTIVPGVAAHAALNLAFVILKYYGSQGQFLELTIVSRIRGDEPRT